VLYNNIKKFGQKGGKNMEKIIDDNNAIDHFVKNK
jgi:hypothetical protein